MYLHYFDHGNNMMGGGNMHMPNMHMPNKEEAMGFFHKHEMKIGGFGIFCCCISLVMATMFAMWEKDTADPEKKKSHNTGFWVFLTGAMFYCGLFCFALGTIMHS